MKMQCRKISLWKAPGPDGVQEFWLKKLTLLHERKVVQLDDILNCRITLPGWMTFGRTVLCLKDPTKENAEDNYRPISWLLPMWKLLTGIIAQNTYNFLEVNNVMAEEQKGCQKNSRGTKDQLLIDKTIERDCK